MNAKRKNDEKMDPCSKRRRSQMSAEKQTVTEQVVSSDAAHRIANNEGPLTEILSRLPVKSLFRSNLVSKYWLDVISNPCFTSLWKMKPASGIIINKLMRMDNQKYKSNIYYFIPLDGDRPTSKPLMRSLDFIGEPVRILQSCNGLLLCRSPRSLSCNLADSKYYICNPLTKQFNTLPSLQSGEVNRMINISLDVDVSEPTTQYKVVAFSLIDAATRHYYKVQLFSSVTRDWRVIAERLESAYLINDVDNGFIWNSSIHWPLSSGYWNIDTERVGSMPVLTNNEGRWTKYFGVSNGHLHVMRHELGEEPQLVVFEMASGHSNWLVKYRIDLVSIARKLPHSLDAFKQGSFTVFSLVRSANEEESFMVLFINGGIFSVKLISGTCKKLCNLKLSAREADEVMARNYRVALHYTENPLAGV